MFIVDSIYDHILYPNTAFSKLLIIITCSAVYFIRHYSEHSLCQMQRPYIIILSRQEKPYSNETRPRVYRRRKHGVRGLGTRDRKLASRGAGAGKGVNLGGGDSAFVCITSMHCTQYRLNFLLLFIVDFF